MDDEEGVNAEQEEKVMEERMMEEEMEIHLHLHQVFIGIFMIYYKLKIK